MTVTQKQVRETDGPVHAVVDRRDHGGVETACGRVLEEDAERIHTPGSDSPPVGEMPNDCAECAEAVA